MIRKFLPSTLLLTIFLFANASFAQLATLVNTVHYDKLFTDGNGLYNITHDTLWSVNTSTGINTFLYKLPASPPGNVVVRWADPFAVKTTNGFIIAQDLVDMDNGFAHTIRVWANPGGVWDTIAVSGSPMGHPWKLGTKYSLYVTRNGQGQMLRTDLTPAGTEVVVSVPSIFNLNPANIKHGDTRIFFGTSGGSNFPSSNSTQLFTMDDNSVEFIDSASNTCFPVANIGDDLFYDYKHQTNIGGTNVITDHNFKKYNGTSGLVSVLIPGLSALSFFGDGIAFNNKVIALKQDSNLNTPNVVSINPITGVQTYLTNLPDGAYYPAFNLQNVGIGSSHLYILTDSSGHSSTWVTDGVTAGSAHKIYSSGNGLSFYFAPQGTYGPSQAAICNDDVYGKQYAATGVFNGQLFHLTSNGTITEQDLTTGVIGGPDYFVKVGSEIFFADATTSATTSPVDLYKITNCSSTGIDNIATDNHDIMLYPNPASDKVTIQFNSNLQDVHIELYDAIGRRVINRAVTNTQTLSLSDLSSGMYLVRLLSNGALVQTKRLSVIR